MTSQMLHPSLLKNIPVWVIQKYLWNFNSLCKNMSFFFFGFSLLLGLILCCGQMFLFLIVQVRGLSVVVNVTWASFRNTFFSGMRKFTVVSQLSNLVSCIASCHDLGWNNRFWHCCCYRSQGKNLSAVTSVTCALSRSTTWSDTKGHTAARSLTAAIHANR